MFPLMRGLPLVHINLSPLGFIGDISSVSHPFRVTPLPPRLEELYPKPSLKEETPTSFAFNLSLSVLYSPLHHFLPYTYI